MTSKSVTKPPKTRKGLFFLGLAIAFLVGGGILYYFLQRAKKKGTTLFYGNRIKLQVSKLDTDDRGYSQSLIISNLTGLGAQFKGLIREDNYYLFDIPEGILDEVRKYAQSIGMTVGKESNEWTIMDKTL